MAAATTTTLGEIALSGDLLGGNANVPSLRPSGVKAGTYTVTDKIYVDGAGRTTWASRLPDDFAWPEASKTTHGILTVGYQSAADNRNIDVSAGNVISVNLATADNAGVVKLGTGLVKNGTTSAVDISLPYADSTTFGQVFPSTGFDAVGGVLGLDLTEVTGWTPATSYSLGMVRPGVGFKMVGDTLEVDTTELDWPIATTTTLGLVKPQGHMYMSATNLNLDIVAPDTNEFGFVQPGEGFQLTSDVLSGVIANDSVFGQVKVDPDYFSNVNGVIGVEWASKTKFGLVASAGTGIDITAGVMTCSGTVGAIPTATTTILGSIKEGSGMEVDGSGVLSVRLTSVSDASDTIKGKVQIGSGLVVNSGVLSIDTSVFTTASDTVKGLMQVGSGLLDFNGIITAPWATTTSKGIVQVGSGLLEFNGIISAPWATASLKGIVQPGSGISINAGSTISIADATSLTKGKIQVGAGLSVTNGVLKTTFSYMQPDVDNVIQGISTFNTSFHEWTSGENLNITNSHYVTQILLNDTNSNANSQLHVTMNEYADCVNNFLTNGQRIIIMATDDNIKPAYIKLYNTSGTEIPLTLKNGAYPFANADNWISAQSGQIIELMLYKKINAAGYFGSKSYYS